MKNTCRLLCLLLALICTVSIFASCGKAKENIDDETEKEKSTETEAETTPKKNGIELVDLGKYEYIVNVRYKATSNQAFYCIDFTAEEKAVDAINRSVADRNNEIEDDFNVIITQVSAQADQKQELINAYLGGDEYEGAIVRAKDAGELATKNVLSDLKNTNMDLSAAYFDQNANYELSLGGKLYYTSGDMNLSTLENAVVTLFNADVFKNYTQLESPYTLVDNNQWTFDKMFELATATTNLDSDQYGYVCYASAGIYYFYAGDCRLSTNDEDGYPSITVSAARATDVVGKIYSLMNVNENSNIKRVTSGNERKTLFQNNQAIFTDMTLWDIRTQYRFLGINYGILPLPKYDTLQEDYKSVVYFQDCCHLWSIPTNCKDKVKAAQMMEIFAAYSTDSTLATYYDNVMSYHAAKDENSMRMLDVVRNHMVYDIGLIYDWGDYLVFFRNVTLDSTNKFASKNKGSLENAVNSMNETIQKFKNPEDPTKETTDVLG